VGSVRDGVSGSAKAARAPGAFVQVIRQAKRM
jgi:hypothetical protein